ncbi:MAG: hypothetical protein WC867_08615 [Candidatus Pacearchaeota archaeon]|jgi:hypothetical protein
MNKNQKYEDKAFNVQVEDVSRQFYTFFVNHDKLHEARMIRDSKNDLFRFQYLSYLSEDQPDLEGLTLEGIFDELDLASDKAQSIAQTANEIRILRKRLNEESIGDDYMLYAVFHRSVYN